MTPGRMRSIGVTEWVQLGRLLFPKRKFDPTNHEVEYGCGPNVRVSMVSTSPRIVMLVGIGVLIITVIPVDRE